MTSRLGKSARRSEFLLTSFFFIILAIGLLRILDTRSPSDSPWDMGEWLINYSGGFVRRGLPGSMILWISETSHLSPTVVVWLLSVFAFAALASVTFRLSNELFRPVLLLSPLVLLAPIVGGYVVRKDTLVLALFGSCLVLIGKHFGSDSSSTRCAMTVFSVNLLSILAILSHESYVFFALAPLTLIMGIVKRDGQVAQRIDFRAGLTRMSPSLVVAAAAIASKGSQAKATDIWHSWKSEKFRFLDNGRFGSGTTEPTGAIDSIGWTLKEGLSLSASILNDFHGPFWDPLVWIVTILVCLWLLASWHEETIRIKVVFPVLLQQLVLVSPLFVLGWDFGRWIFLWTTSSVLLAGFLSRLPGTTPLSWLKMNAVTGNKWATIAAPRALMPGLLLLGIPPCCWTIKLFLDTTAIGYLLGTVTRL